MREIKFRAWNVERKCWMNEEDIYQNVVNQARWNPEIGEYYPLMQYTGLKDKNGKEIYEGDIFPMGVIGFEKGCFNGFYTESRNNDQGWDYSDEWEEGMYDYVDKHEIIGNIYENPELLKQ